MTNFIYSIPTTVYFGEGQLENLPNALQQAGCSHPLLVYGGGSIKKTGLYQQITSKLAAAGLRWSELSGVEPNPRVQSGEKGAAICREKQCDCVLAVGGGSTIDAAKLIAAAAKNDHPAWDLVRNCELIQAALPVFTVLTLSATGSEMDTVAVISNMETSDKMGMRSPLLRPVASILDPTLTYTVNRYQTASGTADIMSHTLESYFSPIESAYFQDRVCEGLLKTCIHYGPIALEQPENYEARANLMWASSWGINDFLKWGKACPWSVHSMEHQLSAYYDITHGEGLAILTPHWMRHVLSDQTVAKFQQYAVNVWGILPTVDPWDAAHAGIDKTAEFFASLGLATTLEQVGINAEKLEIMAQKAATPALQKAYVPLYAEDVLAIYKLALR